MSFDCARDDPTFPEHVDETTPFIIFVSCDLESAGLPASRKTDLLYRLIVKLVSFYQANVSYFPKLIAPRFSFCHQSKKRHKLERLVRLQITSLFFCVLWRSSQIVIDKFTLYQLQKCVQLQRFQPLPSSDNNSARIPPTTTINTPLKRPLHMVVQLS